MPYNDPDPQFTTYPVHNTPGECGKCKRNFIPALKTQYFCKYCRGLPLRKWKDWMREEEALNGFPEQTVYKSATHKRGK